MIDIKMLTATFSDQTFIAMLFKQYINDNRDINLRIQQQYDNKQHEQLYKTLHTLNGALASLYEVDLLSTIKKLEVMCKKGKHPTVNEIIEIQNGLEDIRQQMQQYLSC